MRRHCDGTDEFLVDQAGAPCRCGRRFDDVQVSVVWPHDRIPTHAEKIVLLERLADEHADCCEVGRWAGELATLAKEQR
jgi:hypothetical protein